jgi:hypothetical protein
MASGFLDLDLLVVMPQATLRPQERLQAMRSLRAALLPLRLRVGVDLVVMGAASWWLGWPSCRSASTLRRPHRPPC